MEIHTPNDKNIKHIKILANGANLLFKKLILSGIRSNIDRNNITEDAKEIPPMRKFSVLFLEKNVINAPIMVDNPAIEDRANAIVVFILSP